MAEKRPQLPQFGDWEKEEVLYSAYFENARREKPGKIRHGNLEAELKDLKVKVLKNERYPDQEEGYEVKRVPGSVSVVGRKPAIHSSPKRNNLVQSRNDKLEVEVIRPRHNPRPSREEGDLRRLTDSPLRPEAANFRNSSNSPHHRHGSSSAGDTPRKAARQSVGSDRSSIDHSPHSQTRVAGKSSGISSPSWERKSSSDGIHGLAPLTPGRSRLRSVTRGDDSPERGPAVPKFGDWDETDPSTGEGYTQIFNKVREEKHSDTGRAPAATTTETSNSNGHKQYGNDNPKGCSCFPWGRS
ncbi:RPM1-interacting protein 4-like [Andrographis paniculata]|uniref:RPM1-interacting protein 4-like n=1 Tax=Andrographis paniculata TaxID=175694 RepID=UPI0021E7120A|nr:RPM1-interacting protein 4-like [Andrographis paniculata]